MADRGYPPDTVELARRWFAGEFARKDYLRIFMRIGGAYNYRPVLGAVRALVLGGWRTKSQPDALIFGGQHLAKGWTVMDRLGEIHIPTLVVAGRDDFVFPPECQRELAAGIPNADLQLVDRAGHNPHNEQTQTVMRAVRELLIQPAPIMSPR